MTYSKLKHAAMLLAAALLMTGCIPVKNVEKAWKDATVDQNLAGTWVDKNGGDGMVGFVKTDKDFLVTSGTTGLEGGVKTITTNKHNYIIIAKFRAAILGFDNVDGDTKSGTLVRYTIKDDVLTLYTFNQDKLKAALKENKVPGEIDENDSPSLTELDEATLKWLGEIGDEKEGWDPQAYKRK